MSKRRFFALITDSAVLDTGLRETRLPGGHYAYLASTEAELAGALIPAELQTDRHLVVLCDDENAVRVSVVRNGAEEQAFHYHSELYRSVDGEPPEPKPLAELAHSPDVELVKNALDLGLEAFGLPITSDTLATQLGG